LVTLTSGVPNKREELQHLLSCFIVRVTKNFDTERIFDKTMFSTGLRIPSSHLIFVIDLWLRLCDNLAKFNIIQNFNIFSKERIQ